MHSTLILVFIIQFLVPEFFSMFTLTNLRVQKKSAILWDVDGTLCDSYMLCFTSTNKVLSLNGYQHITEDDYHAGTKLTTPRRFAWHTTGNPDDAVGESLGKQFDDLYVELVSKETALLYKGIQGLTEFVGRVNNLKQGALSNACGSYVRAVLSANEVSQYFSVQAGADEVPAAKPSPLGLLLCCEQLDCTPRNSIYIGDSPSDGLAAKAAGMYGIGVTWGSHPVETVSPAFDKTVHTVDELEAALISWLKNQGLGPDAASEVSADLSSRDTIVAPTKAVSWRADVVDNEGLGKKKTDDEFW